MLLWWFHKRKFLSQQQLLLSRLLEATIYLFEESVQAWTVGLSNFALDIKCRWSRLLCTYIVSVARPALENDISALSPPRWRLPIVPSAFSASTWRMPDSAVLQCLIVTCKVTCRAPYKRRRALRTLLNCVRRQPSTSPSMLAAEVDLSKRTGSFSTTSDVARNSIPLHTCPLRHRLSTAWLMATLTIIF
jgi:hypothetical protein